MSTYDIGRVIALLLVALLLVGPAFLRTNRSMSVILRNLAIWLAIAVVASFLYQFYR